ncbi:MAG: flagellar biosynthesis protein FlhF [Gammaproteobacteria bacterium]|nr:flagellar biosynthesis protein FlhF [Gammaproteobacteria bacterium]
MKIKRYFAPDIRQAIRKVREEQGPDAVILSNRKTDGGVEIVAAVDYDAFLADLGASGARAAGETPASGNKSKPAAAVSDDAGDPIADMGRELKNLRGMLEHQLSGLAWGEMGRKHPQRLLLIRRLRDLGLSTALAQRIAVAIPEQPDMERVWRQGIALFAHHLPVTNDDILAHGGTVALVGPTGVGKTTTIAKLAARFVLRHGPKSVALIAADDQRIGAHEQLRIYGQILDLPVRVARDAAGLRQALAEFRGHRLVLIDTAGMSQRDARLAEQLSLVSQGLPGVKRYLVLAANGQSAAIEETLTAFAVAAPHAAILTKLDETSSLGGVLSALSARGLPVAYVSEGQRVPEDLAPARSHSLVSRCVAIAQQTRETIYRRPEQKKVALHA